MQQLSHNKLLCKSMKLPKSIKQKIESVVSNKLESDRIIDEEARGYGAIALLGTLGEIWALRPDGSFWSIFDEKSVMEPLEEKHIKMAIAVGIWRFPWLKSLLPEKSFDDVECPYCKGLGKIGDRANWSLCYTCEAKGFINRNSIT